MDVRFSEPQEYVLTSTQDINLFLAGVGSGKTHLGGFISGYYLQNFPEAFGFIAANTYQQLTTSTLYRTREVWEDYFGWKEKEHYVVGIKPPAHFDTSLHNFDDYKGIISFRWGAVAFKGSLDNAKAHDGKEFGWAILDETKDSREEDVKDTILTRLRKPGIYIGEDGQLTRDKIDEDTLELNRSYNPLYILTSPAKVLWLNQWFDLDEYQAEILKLIYNKDEFFIKEFKDKCVVISSTWHNEKNLPKGYIDRVINNHSEEGAKRLIYGNPFVKAGNEFYSSFDRLTHVHPVEFNPDLPIHISFDQNVVPYVTATLYQIDQVGDTMEVRQFDEICLKNPRNKTSKLCIEFIKRWGAKCTSGLYYYGDPSGKNRDTRGSENDYNIIVRLLRRYLTNKSNRVPYKHPGVLKRKDFANDMMDGGHNFKLIIDPKCKNSIADFEFVKEDHNGKKSKEKYKDKETGASYEKFGHTSDSFDYFICKAFERTFKRHYK